MEKRKTGFLAAPVNGMTGKEYADEIVKRTREIKKNGLDMLTEIAIPMDRKTNEELNKKINASQETDIIYLTGRSDNALRDIFTPSDELGLRSVPSDILFAGTIPVMDMCVHVNETDTHPENGIMAENAVYRVVIFPDFKEILENTPENEFAEIGALVMNVPASMKELKNGTSKRKTILKLSVCKGTDMLGSSNMMGYMGMTWEEAALISRTINGSIGEMLVDYMTTWYAIELALLNPLIHESIGDGTKKIAYDRASAGNRNGKNNRKKTKTRYVRHLTIKKENIDNALYGEPQSGTGKKYHRKKLLWYTIGHWRSNGPGRKRSFVKGHWKGPLKDVKSLREARERTLSTDDISLDND